MLTQLTVLEKTSKRAHYFLFPFFVRLHNCLIWWNPSTSHSFSALSSACRAWPISSRANCLKLPTVFENKNKTKKNQLLLIKHIWIQMNSVFKAGGAWSMEENVDLPQGFKSGSRHYFIRDGCKRVRQCTCSQFTHTIAVSKTPSQTETFFLRINN